MEEPPVARTRVAHRWGRLVVVAALLLLAAPSAGGAALCVLQDDLQELVRQFRSESSAPQRIELGRSVLAQIEDDTDEELRAEVHLQLGVDLIGLERFGAAREHFEAAQTLARRLEDPATLAHSLWQLGVISFHLGDFHAGAEWAAEGAEIAESLGRLDILWRCANIQGLILERAGDREAALEAFARGVEAAEQSNDLLATATLTSNIGIALMNLGELEQALDTFVRAMELEISAGYPDGQAQTVANLGDVSILLEDFDVAYDYHQEALRLREELGSEMELALSYHSLGAIHFLRGELDQALARYEQALELRRKLGLLPEQATTLGAMARVYVALDEDDRATEAARRSLEITDEIEMLGRRLAILESLATVYEEQGRYAEALDAYLEAWAVEREQSSEETRLQYARFQAELDSKEQERQIAVLTKEGELNELALNKQQQTRNFLIAGSLLLALVALAGWGAWAALRRTHRALSAANAAVQRHSAELEEAAHRIKRLEGLLPICAHCKSIRDDAGAWHRLESYVSRHSEASFTHGICPSCKEELLADSGLLARPAEKETSGHGQHGS